MSTHPYAGKSAPKELLIDVGRLEAAFYEGKPDPSDPSDPNKLVSFGTSGHRGTSSNETFTESHILPLLRPSVNTGATRESLGRFLWAKTLTHFLDPQSESHWRCWPQTVSRHIFNEWVHCMRLCAMSLLILAVNPK
jgi:hypothetical protein